MTVARRIILLLMLVSLLGCASQIQRAQTSQPVQRKCRKNNQKNRRCQPSPIALDTN
jgi:hypothetical protein